MIETNKPYSAVFVDWTTGYEVTYIPASSIPVYGIGLYCDFSNG
jgi:hypothetical protein